MNLPAKIRVGAVSYLNTKPLIYGFERFAPDAELVLDYPSKLADALAAGTLDVALIPSIEFFQDPTYTIVSDACIGCRGPVLSVKALFRVPPAAVRTLALDAGSRTSAVLAQILLDDMYGVRPELSELAIGASAAEAHADAVVVIGDRAIRESVDASHSDADIESRSDSTTVWDLGQRWCQWTGLPFVFAAWAARPGPGR